MAGLVSILGAGESGVGSAILAKTKGWDVWASDFGKVKDGFRDELQQYELPFEENGHDVGKILDSELVIKSPGIPDSAPVVKACLEANIPVISEIEFAGRYTDATTVCITGSNGKTTTTLLTYHILKASGMNVGLAGNIGESFARQVALAPKENYVLELSSFQLDGMYDFRADISMILNITPDHLDRYDYNFQNYVNAKFRITQNQRSKDHFIYNGDDPVIQAELAKRDLIAKAYPFYLTKPTETLSNGAFSDNKQLYIHTQNQEFSMKIQELALQGKHNLTNSMAAGVSARIFDLRKELVRDSLTNFENIEHRLETVGKVNGVTFVNDSKATNINSTWYALESINKPIIWIAGGVDKGNDYGELYEMVDEKVKAVICLGKNNKKLRAAFTGRVENVIETSSANEAVQVAYELSRAGDTVLLSPACASFDLFEDYEDRGRKFKAAVKRL